jgi:cytoskeletal protein CcmA (bactofilin family)
MEKHVSDLVINGISGAAGGTYNSVRIDGIGTINGAVKARTFKANGLMRLKGDLAAEELECNGNMSVKGSLRMGTMKMEGMLQVGGNLRGESCELNGMISMRGDCELEELSGEGAFTVDGLLSAGHVDFGLHGQGKAKEIGVESLVIRQVHKSATWNRLLGGIIPKLKPELIAGTIEGDFIDVEYTNADIIRGNIVIIGQGCTIGTVEYRSQLTVHPGARVGREEKTGV